MDGPTLSGQLASLAIAATLALGACADLDPKPDPVPFALYDSPVVAGGIPDDEAADRKAPAKRDQQDEKTASTDEADRRPEPSPPPQTETASVEESPDEEAEPSSSDSVTPPLASRRASESETDVEPASDGDTSDATPDRGGASAGADAARYVSAIYELNDVSFSSEARTSITKMYRHCRERDAVFQSRAPDAGDLVFFHNVRDANGDGRNNDWYTWVGLVERVSSTGTVHVLGYRGGKVRSLSLNLNRPDSRTDGGATINTQLREETSDDPPFTQYLAGQLFAGYCSLLGDRAELLVVDNWQPGMELKPPR